MLKTIKLLDSTLKELEIDSNKVVEGSSKVNDKNLSKKSKNAKSGIQIYIFLTFYAKKTFN